MAREIHLLRTHLPPHEHIVPLLDVIETQRSFHLVFEYAAGGTVQRLIEAEGALPEAAACCMARQLCCAVQHLHAHRARER